MTNTSQPSRGGLRGDSSRRTEGGKRVDVSLKVGPVGGSAGSASREEREESYSDHHSARLKRFLDACQSDPEDHGYVEVTQPDDEFATCGFGAILDWECDIYIPESVKAMSQAGEALAMLKAFRPMAEMLGEDMSDMPDQQQADALGNFLQDLNIRPTVVGEDNETDWRIVGTVSPEYLREGSDLDGRVRVVGKVTKKIPAKRWHSILDLPGSNLVSREDRRRLAKDGPKPGEEDNFVQGPAVLLDVITIYR